MLTEFHRTPRMNKTKFVLFLGFGSVMSLLLLLMGITLHQITQAEHRIESVVLENNIKTELITIMRTMARERTVSLEKMLIIEDPIEISDEWEKFYALGERFVNARQQYLDMTLTEAEKDVVRRQADLVRDNSRLQVEVTDLILEGHAEKARDLLLNIVMPMQDKVFIFMTEMMALQQKAAAGALAKAKQEYRITVITMIIIALLVITVSSFIIRIIINGISQTERQLHNEKERALITLQSIGDAVITTDANGNIEQMNRRAETLTETSLAACIGQPLDDTIHLALEQNPEQRIRPVTDVLTSHAVKVSAGDSVLRHSDNSASAIDYTAAPIFDQEHNIIGTILTMRDVSEIRAMANELAHHARHDNLTGLLNRREFENYLRETHDEISRYTHEHAWLCFLDLDKFKTINDSCGHLAGDALLKQVADILNHHTRKTDHVARLGGDEFCIILRHCDQNMALSIMDRIRESILEHRFCWENQSFTIGASIGITPITADDNDINQLLSKADSACYEAKRGGRNRVQVFKKGKNQLH